MADKDIIVVENIERLAIKGAVIFCRAANAHLGQNGRFSVAISGGSTPRAMHRLLAQKPYVKEIPWQGTHIFWVDERMVPFEHSASNFGTAKKDFLEKIPIPKGNIHPMPALTIPEEGVGRYQNELNTFFQPGDNVWPVFDLIFLGIGSDGHIASLFPQVSLPSREKRWVLLVKGGTPDVFRLTLTYPLLNHARQVVFLVSGNEKAEIVKRILVKREKHLPAVKIMPKSGKLVWILDREAASLLSK